MGSCSASGCGPKQLESIRHWLSIPEEHNPARFLRLHALQNLWRGRTIYHTVEAQAYWSQDPLFLDEAMKTWISTMEESLRRRTFISPSIAAVWLTRVLRHSYGRAPVVSPATYDHFLKLVPVWNKDRSIVDHERAQLGLCDPRGCDPDPALAFIRHYTQPENQTAGIRSIFAPRTVSGRHVIWRFFVATAQALQRQDRTREANTVLDLGRQTLPPELFAMRPPGSTRPTGFKVFKRELSETERDHGGEMSEREMRLLNRRRRSTLDGAAVPRR